ncbi:LuxR family two component transcriptional regulator [Novosphingobium sp. PhB57]|jgi:DNA-binding NarL/FixJ family response regulator|uniref:response regulator n=1 Tax=unclassified Novosphingobium TaxID=2644732 RepID=UPI00104DF995|nr:MULTISPECIES: response regulator transcription factor [unclassified Novosphingobium]TCU61919.1 LuxR family two component transcriptional regulator [Novosphingobium sp. PhB57]TDW68987.1 LuxR family two component transcriptional regulator [Novosphingobium sp. PhB55]
MRPITSRILIADDHQAMRQGVRTLLESHADFQVVGEAADGREALNLAVETKPDIAILDYSLPLMNGLELTRAIKHELPRTEILIYTMHDRESILIDVLRAGARGYVLKSDSGVHLVSAAKALAKRKPYFSGAISETLLEHFIDTNHSTDKSIMLTAREREIVQLIAEGKLNKQIAHMLGISVKTVETHRAAAMHKLKLRTTAELVLYAVRNNIVEP